MGARLRAVRNIRPGFAKFGLCGGMLNAAVDTYVFRGQAPWTLSAPHADNEATLAKADGRGSPTRSPTAC